MKIFVLFLLLIVMMFSNNAHAKENIEYNILYTKKNIRVILVYDDSKNEGILSKIGRSRCNNRQFCLIWFFADPTQAEVGVSRARSGNWFDPIPGQIGIYSKNKAINKLICHSTRLFS